MRKIQAKKGLDIECKGWEQEAVLRMLYNNLDPEVAEHPEELVVYGVLVRLLVIGKRLKQLKTLYVILKQMKRC